MVLLSELLIQVNRWLSEKLPQPTSNPAPKSPVPTQRLPVVAPPTPVSVAPKPAPPPPTINAVTTRYGFEDDPITPMTPTKPSAIGSMDAPPSEVVDGDALPLEDDATKKTIEEEPSILPDGVNLDFGKLWKQHPTIAEQQMSPCRRPDGVPNFGNQSAIRMGVCLSQSQLLADYDGDMCRFGHVGHSLRPRELALWLRNHPLVFGSVEMKKTANWQDYVGRVGIIYCQNVGLEGSQIDHIDLWDGTGAFMSGGQFSWEGPAMASGGLDYIERSEEVWFWPVY